MAIDTSKDMERICQCMEILKDAEPRYVSKQLFNLIDKTTDELYRWAIAGRLWCADHGLVRIESLSTDK